MKGIIMNNEINGGSFFICGIPNAYLDAKTREFLRQNILSGIILFKRNIESLEQVIDLNSNLISLDLNNKLIISVDEEGGRVSRLKDIVTPLPSMMSLKDRFLSEAHLAFKMSAMLGRELAALGFSLNFAPVCDVLTNDENKVIGDRAFSNNFDEASTIALEFTKGLQASGVMACAKHFPGHGHTKEDSHFELPVSDIDDIALLPHLKPFIEQAKAKVSSIMTAHISLPKIDNKFISTLSEKILQNLLREKLLFDGLIISDDLDMNAVKNKYSLEEIIYNGVLSGVDQFIIGNNLAKTEEAINIFQKFLRDDLRFKEKAYTSYKRASGIRAKFIGSPCPPSLEQANKIVRSRPHLELVSKYS